MLQYYCTIYHFFYVLYITILYCLKNQKYNLKFPKNGTFTRILKSFSYIKVNEIYVKHKALKNNLEYKNHVKAQLNQSAACKNDLLFTQEDVLG